MRYLGLAVCTAAAIMTLQPARAQSVRVWHHFTAQEWRRFAPYQTLKRATLLPIIVPADMPHGYAVKAAVSGHDFEKAFGEGKQDYTIYIVPRANVACLTKNAYTCPGIRIDVANTSAGGDIPERSQNLYINSRIFGKVRISPFQGGNGAECYGAFQYAPPNGWLFEMEYSTGGKSGLLSIESCDPNISEADLGRVIQSFMPVSP